MFGKLIKYEWKAVMRSMLPIYGALAAISVINAFLFRSADGKRGCSY